MNSETVVMAAVVDAKEVLPTSVISTGLVGLRGYSSRNGKVAFSAHVRWRAADIGNQRQPSELFRDSDKTTLYLTVLNIKDQADLRGLVKAKVSLVFFIDVFLIAAMTAQCYIAMKNSVETKQNTGIGEW